jgi:hypothetical protein
MPDQPSVTKAALESLVQIANELHECRLLLEQWSKSQLSERKRLDKLMRAMFAEGEERSRLLTAAGLDVRTRPG